MDDHVAEAASVCGPFRHRPGECTSTAGTHPGGNHECCCVRSYGHRGNEHGCPCGRTWTDPQRPADGRIHVPAPTTPSSNRIDVEDPMNRPKASVYAQETTDGRWIWWITSTGNHTTLAKSARRYSTEASALRAAKAVASLGDIEIDERNRR